MIQSFGNKLAQDLFDGANTKEVRRFAKDLQDRTQVKLSSLDYATCLDDLRFPPGNHLEALQGNLKEFYSIRINQQWRIIFQWTEQGPAEVTIVDYH